MKDCDVKDRLLQFNQAAATTLFAVLFLLALGNAWRHIRRRDIAAHPEWMIRAFFDRSGRRDDPTHCWNLFRHSRLYGTDTLRILRD